MTRWDDQAATKAIVAAAEAVIRASAGGYREDNRRRHLEYIDPARQALLAAARGVARDAWNAQLQLDNSGPEPPFIRNPETGLLVQAVANIGPEFNHKAAGWQRMESEIH